MWNRCKLARALVEEETKVLESLLRNKSLQDCEIVVGMW